jgi:hypothetical protein
MKQVIASYFLTDIVTSDEFVINTPCKDTGLLFPEFWAKVQASIAAFNERYPDIEIVIVETYRSNVLQHQYYLNGASKINKDGMHHFGIAADLAFKINGKFSYQGDYEFLRTCHTAQGLHLLGLWDIGHVQFIDVADQLQLRNEVETVTRKFQSEHGLVSDGIIGPKTIAKAKEVFKNNG